MDTCVDISMIAYLKITTFNSNPYIVMVGFHVNVGNTSRSQRQMDALLFVFSFGLVEKFPLVPLLKAYLKHQRKALEEIEKKGRYHVRSLVCLFLLLWFMLHCQYKLSKY